MNDKKYNTNNDESLWDVLFSTNEQPTYKSIEKFDPYDWENPNNCSEREYDDDDDYDDFDNT